MTRALWRLTCLLLVAAPVRAAEPGQNLKAKPPASVAPADATTIDELLLRGAEPIALIDLVEEALDDLAFDLAQLDAQAVSPMAVKAVTVSPNLRSAFARSLETRVTSVVATATQIRQVHCAQCRALRSRVIDGEWVVQLGAVTAKDVAALGDSLGATTFLELDLSYSRQANAMDLQARVVRASDSVILWSESYASDGTTAALLRGRERVKSRSERREELDRLIQGKPYYGHAVMLGTTILPWDMPGRSSVVGMAGGYRLFERFGPDRKNLFGLQLEGFFNINAPLLGAFVGAAFQREISTKSLFLPEVRVGGAAGGFLVGTEGNSFYAEGSADMMLKFRFGLGVSLLYLYPAQYLGYDLGGLGFRARLTFNW